MEALFSNMFYFYCFMFLFLFLFFFFSVLVLKSQLRKQKNIHTYLKEFNFSNNEGDINFLVSVFQNLKYFTLFDQMLTMKDKKIRTEILDFIQPILVSMVSFIRKSSEAYQVFFLSFLAKYPILLEGKNNPLVTYVVEGTISSSFAIVDKSFLVLNLFGNSELVKKSLLLMSQKNIVHHPKLITNSLLRFQGNVAILGEFLVKDLKKYLKYLQVACIDFLGDKKIDAKVVLLGFMQDLKEDKEVRIACIRYFGKVKYKEAAPYLYQYLKEDVNSFEIATVAAKALGNYPYKDTTNHLLEALGSYSWYVRNNAAASIVRINDSDVVRRMLRQIGDKYAYESLMYQKKLQEGKR